MIDSIKSKFSLATLNAISPIIRANSSKINISTNNDIIVLLQEVNNSYDFFFRIENEEMVKGSLNVKFTCRPFSELENIAKGTLLPLDAFKKKLANWFDYIEQYKSAKLIDDPILKQYEDEFNADFTIVDEDAKDFRFNFSQQILLLNYIERVEDYIKFETEELSEEERSELVLEAESLKKVVSNETKDNYIKKQSSFWAKIRKKSIKVCDFVVKEFAKEVIKEMTKRGIQIAWESLPAYIDSAKNILSN